ncbi:MAG: hypothetical protein AB7H97_00175 [Pseudobdellovibrionaceae bacterium]
MTNTIKILSIIVAFNFFVSACGAKAKHITDSSKQSQEGSFEDEPQFGEDPTLEETPEESPAPTPSPIVETPKDFRIDQEAEKFKTRYGVNNVYTKIVDNRGKGDSDLWGARNMRVVMHGVMYRGGANNVYFDPPRNNSNPLPTTGIKNLCEEDFSTGVYLYSANYSTAPTSYDCKNTSHQNNKFQYKQYSPVSKTSKILELVYKRIKGELSGPVYTHCWNGWHYGGLISAIALKQFCGWTNAQADAYWVKNTDGNSSGYENLRKIIRDFKPLSQFAIAAEEKAAICIE